MAPRSHEPYPLSRQSTEPVGSNSACPRPKLYSKYDKVEVLLLQWQDDDLGVNTEIQELNRLFRSHYNFTTYVRYIPSEDAEDYLTRTIVEFRKGKGCNDLLIVYYGGHAAGSAIKCTWIANIVTPRPPTLNWLSVQGLLLEYSAHVLLILDCCYATHAARGSSVSDNWLLAASAKESQAIGVSWGSFTSALNRQLKRQAEFHRANGQPFTVQSIHGSLVVWERDLDVTPVITRLTDHECESTDLTPLEPTPPVLRLNSSPSATPDPSLLEPLRSHLPQQPGVRSAVHAVVNRSHDKSLMVRLSDLPLSSTRSDVVHWLSDRLGQENIISRVAPLTTSEPSSTVVTFSSVAVAEKALTIHDRHFRAQASGGKTVIRIDNNFLGLSCLYSSTGAPDRNPTVDLVFVHGTDGHAINSFATRFINPTREALWPCDELPDFLEGVGIHPRVLTFGWNANDWLDPLQDNQRLSEACDNLRLELDRERSGCKNRPIIFVGHGVGGLLVKQVVLDIVNFAFSQEYFDNPIRACFFFAVPHHSDDENGLASILAAMDSVVRRNEVPDFARIASLYSRNQIIVPFSREFNDVCTQHGIHVHCFYETKPTGNMYIVPENSAVLDHSSKHSHRIDADFRDIIQLSKSEPNLRQVLGVMQDIIQKKLSPKPARKSMPMLKKENVYPGLRRYDTVFIVDDSDSMAGPHWFTASNVLAKIAPIAVSYDGDGVDVRFFNAYPKDEERLNLDSADRVMELFKKVTPDGTTPTADVLEDELNQYLAKFREKRNRKRLNLIVLTDGQPDDVQAVEDVIVKYANELKELKAHPLQVGVQFVQIGGDEDASNFLRGLDDDLVKKRNLDRDVRFLSIQTRTATDWFMYRWWIQSCGMMMTKNGSLRKFYSVVF